VAKKGGRRYLLCRYGGIGDTLLLTSLAGEIKRREPGSKVDVAVRAETSELFEEEDVFDGVLPTKRFPPTNVDAVEVESGWVSTECIKPQYDKVYDLRFSVENNVPTVWLPLSETEGPWRRSMSSNYVNWIDMSFGWCNIDPQDVAAEHKVPTYTVLPEELEWAKERVHKQDGDVVIGIHLQASSLCRTWYKADELPKRLKMLLPEAKILFFDPTSLVWQLQGPLGTKTIDVKSEGGLRKSAALLTQMDLFVCADSGYSHIAAALGIPTLTLYSTVPAWTRELYYEKANFIQSDLSCSPCFSLDGVCPRQQKRARERLSDREKKLLKFEEEKVPPPIAAREMDMPLPAFMQEHAAARQRLRSMSTEEPDCMKNISPEMIAEKAKEILDELKA